MLRADGPGLPTLSTLCVDPTREPVPLQIWNRCGGVGVIGVFHALVADGHARAVSGAVGPRDVPGLLGKRFACNAQRSGQLLELADTDSVRFSLAARQFELYWLAPIEDGIALLGLADKLNGPAALHQLTRPEPGAVQLMLADGGELLAFCDHPPHGVEAAGEAPAFRYDAETRALRGRLTPSQAREVTLRWDAR